jgi:hypothetical protein
MQLLLFIVHAFINTFGITRPTAAGERRAAMIIGALLLAILIGMIAMFFVVHGAMR